MKLKKFTAFTFMGIFLLFTLLTVYIFIEPFLLVNKEDTIIDPDLPPAFDNFKIVFISDIHHGPYFSRSRVKQLVSRINDIEPDLILLGGDYVHRHPRYIKSCFEELAKLQADYGVWGVLGNHDHWEGKKLSLAYMDSAGIEVLDNAGFWIVNNEDSIRLGGVGDMWEDRQDLTELLDKVNSDHFVILISHNPDFAEYLYTDLVDLMLCGHTHGGQITFFNLWAPILPSEFGQKYRSGRIETSSTTIIVSNGVGTITPPVRFCCPPQINIITLKIPSYRQ
ncbi:MAG: metallophosphoesterase [bacterium]